MGTPASSLSANAVGDKHVVAVWGELFKIRLTALVLLTTAAGFYLGSPGAVELGLLARALAGTALLAAGAAALNQWWERPHDAKMLRTRDRPLPSGRLRPERAFQVGLGSAAIGLTWLAFGVNPLTAALGGLTLLLYLLLYTPLKRVTSLNTLVGAIPGALPPVMGWAAARGAIDVGGWSLFAILACWQVPHFLAIAWLYRDDYARAGYVMISVSDADGRRTSTRAVAHALALLLASAGPFALHLVNPGYLVGALGLGLAFVAAALHFRRAVSPVSARRLFYASILYLPLLLGLMVATKVRA